MSKEKIFVDVETIGDFANILGSFAEDDLIKYDRDSRTQICDELLALCRKFKIEAPRFLKNVSKSQDLYDKQAELRDIKPQAPLDYINDEYDMNFASFEAFRLWLAAQDMMIQNVEHARATVKIDDTEFDNFLKEDGVEQ